MSGDRFLAVDWGTTNRRTYLIDGGSVIEAVRDDLGVANVPPGCFDREIMDLRERLGDHPMLLAGMVGSNIGWQMAPYVEVPAGAPDLAAALLRVDDKVAIVPGVRTKSDIMRGEEVQLLGAVALGEAPANALLCQPGTHCKWADIVDGRIAGFTTAMTGELFALIRANSLLARQLGGEVTAGAAFDEGVEHGNRRDLVASLFGIRAAGVLGLRDDADAASYASGLLIGGDVAARVSEVRHDIVHILADPGLGALYARAIEAHGLRTAMIDSHAAFVAGITAIRNLAT